MVDDKCLHQRTLSPSAGSLGSTTRQITDSSIDNSTTASGPDQISAKDALYLADDVMALLDNGAESVDWWALHNGAADNSADLGLLSGGGQRESGQGPLPTVVPYAPYYGTKLLTGAFPPGSELLAATSSAESVDVHAVCRPDGRLAVLLIDTDQQAAHQVRLRLPPLLPGARVVSLTGSSTEHGAVATARTLPANSLTALIVRPRRSGAS
jgi:alpha-N-arabinofuranosidase